MVYEQTSGESRQLMEDVHQEQGATAVDYTRASDKNLSPRATQLFEAINGGVWGWGTTNPKLFQALRNLNPAEYKELQRVYQDHHPGRDLSADIKGDLSDNDLKRAECLMRGETLRADAIGLREAMRGAGTNESEIHAILAEQSTPQNRAPNSPGEDAKQLFKAMDGIGTNEAKIHRILQGRSREEINQIREAYRAQTQGRDLDADLRSELSGRDLFNAQMSLRGRATRLEDSLARMNERYEYERGGDSNGIEDLATDASIGAVDGLATVTGMKAGTAVAQNALRATATNTLRQEGLQVTERTVAHMSQELLSGSTRARVAFGALEGTVDGALGGALGEGGTTAFSDGTWDQGFTAGLQRMGVNTALGGGFGAFGGALGGGVFGRKSTHLADDLVDALPLAKTDGRGGINEGEFARSGISLKQAENMRQELLAQADTARVQDNLRSLGVTADREMIETVKQYNFDSPGIVFDAKNHDAWSRLANGVSASALQENRIAPDKFLPPGNKAFLARSELDTLEYLSSERITLGLTSNSSLRKNLTVAEFNINGEIGVLRALSKEPKAGRLDANLVEIPDPSNRVFTTSVVDDIDRAFDSEVKILETIAAKYDPDTAKGTINLSSELWNCGSCQGVIKQFSERFKGIEINSKAGLFQKKILQKQANIPLLYKGQ